MGAEAAQDREILRAVTSSDYQSVIGKYGTHVVLAQVERYREDGLVVGKFELNPGPGREPIVVSGLSLTAKGQDFLGSEASA